VQAEVARLFEHPDPETAQCALSSIRAATAVAQAALDAVHRDRDRRHDAQRLLSYLHFIYSALLDRDNPLGALARRRVHGHPALNDC